MYLSKSWLPKRDCIQYTIFLIFQATLNCSFEALVPSCHAPPDLTAASIAKPLFQYTLGNPGINIAVEHKTEISGILGVLAPEMEKLADISAFEAIQNGSNVIPNITVFDERKPLWQLVQDHANMALQKTALAGALTVGALVGDVSMPNTPKPDQPERQTISAKNKKKSCKH